jgi:hypothetical protein
MIKEGRGSESRQIVRVKGTQPEVKGQASPAQEQGNSIARRMVVLNVIVQRAWKGRSALAITAHTIAVEVTPEAIVEEASREVVVASGEAVADANGGGAIPKAR